MSLFKMLLQSTCISLIPIFVHVTDYKLALWKRPFSQKMLFRCFNRWVIFLIFISTVYTYMNVYGNVLALGKMASGMQKMKCAVYSYMSLICWSLL